MKYDDRMDTECIKVCDALNALPGITTSESCCGHGTGPFLVFFIAHGEIQEILMPIVRAIESSGWDLDAYFSNGSEVVMFCLESRANDPTYGDLLAERLESSERSGEQHGERGGA